jgi:hypothetical protein
MTSTDPARKTFITMYQIFCPFHFREVDLASLVLTLDAMGVDFFPAHQSTAQEALEY